MVSLGADKYKNKKNLIEVGGEIITLEQLFAAIPVSVVLVDRKGDHILNSQALVAVNNPKVQDLAGRKVSEMSPEGAQNIERDFKLFDQNKTVPTHELVINDKIYKVSVTPLRNESGYAFAELVVLTDITENKDTEHKLAELNKKLKYLASRDGLTNLLNKSSYCQICNKLINLARRENTPFSVMFIDIDYFKKVNDTYGHAVGDIVLKRVAECIVENCRKSDIVGRVGGEEIAVYLPQTDCYGAVALAEKIRTYIEQSKFDAEEIIVTVTVSIGISANKPHHKTIEDIKKDADAAMYMAKSNGRNRIEYL
ncbi:sensor domain-containing diguanylate cyclase [Pectinatus haikarae]|nr:sensor domain-containing diguanylate cyclase [Pectinatus haikarae]